MKHSPWLFVIAASLLLIGCSDSSKPLASGTCVSGTMWQQPLSKSGSNSGSEIPQGSQVDVYETLILIHLKDGTSLVVPMDFVSDLKLK